MAKVTVRVPVLPSEDPKKVEAAARNLFPDLALERGRGELVGRTESLDHFGKLLHRQRILDTARAALLGSLEANGRRATVRFGKQAAAAGRVSLALDEAPLGDIVVTFEGERLEEALKRLAPKTHKGFPLSEEEAEALEARERVRRAAAKAKDRGGKEE